VIEVAASAKGAGSGVPIKWFAYIVAHVRDGKIAREAMRDRDAAFESVGLTP
jgi:hypothetical protein